MRVARARRIIGTVMLGAAAGATGAEAGAQLVTLQIKPHIGDTLRMRLDQQSEMTGVKRTSTGEATAMVIATMKMFSRAIIESSSEKHTAVLAVTDSVLLTTTDERARAATMQAAVLMRGQRVRFRVAPDGTVGMSETDGVSRDVAQVVSVMPAAFPKGPIGVGETWTREMPLPASSQLGAQLNGRLHVTFRFDSLTHGGDWAFVSMRGEMSPAVNYGTPSSADLEKGVVNGTMLVDQKRGWLTDSWFTIIVNSVVTPPLMTGIISMRYQMRITQHMHTAERR